MKRILLAATALAVLAAPAMAADIRARAPVYKVPAPIPPVAQVYNWTGFYIGGHVGGAFTGGRSPLGSSDARFLGGVQVGADYQFAPNWLIGAEAQYSWLPRNNNAGGLAFAPAGLASLDNRAIGSVTGRIGYVWGPALLYAKGGYAWNDRNIDVTSFGLAAPFSASGGRDGYTVGAGLEYMFAPNWSAKVEYQYYDFGRTAFNVAPAALAGTSFRNDEHTVKAGLNYRFTWGGQNLPRY